ncbi:MAG: AMP-binding protein [Pseudomonadota bacterium]|nr:AMP-binding protein [Pseudomonadota bacterium]
MLEGVVRYPPEYAKKYREKGYWKDRSIASHYAEWFDKYADRTAIIDGEKVVTYRELDQRSTRVALNLIDLGFVSLDRVVVCLPNVIEFSYLYFAFQKIGMIPIMALPTHRYMEVSQFVEIAQAKACVVPAKARDYSFTDLVNRLRNEHDCLTIGIVLGPPQDDFVTVEDLLDTEPNASESDLGEIQIDPEDPAVFQLSGGTTGIQKLIPRTHNDYICNSRLACASTETGPDKVLLDILPIGHNLPLACPGMQGFLMKGGTVVFSQTTRGEVLFPLIEKHGVTHVHCVPALLIRWLHDPAIGDHDLSSLQYLQSGGQRLQPEVRRRTYELIPSVFVQENFGMAEGMLFFAEKHHEEAVRMETVGFPMCEDDEVRIVDEEDNVVPFGEVGEMCCRGPYTLRGYFGTPEHNARAFTVDGFYRTGDLMRQHPSGAYLVEGRKKDLINRGGEKISAEEIENLILTHPAVKNVACVAMPDPVLGERMCACIIPAAGQTLDLQELTCHLESYELARFKLPERLKLMGEFPLSPFGKVSKKNLVEDIAANLADEGA